MGSYTKVIAITRAAIKRQQQNIADIRRDKTAPASVKSEVSKTSRSVIAEYRKQLAMYRRLSAIEARDKRKG